jgi:hypothetical protein
VITVREVYSRVIDPLLEPGGLMLGLVSYSQFSDYLCDSVNDFLRQTGLAKIFITQTIGFGTSQYTTPDAQLSVEQVFVSGRFIPYLELESIDITYYQWKKKTGVPKVWHTDGLAIKTVEIVLPPNWQGALYSSATPPAVQIIQNGTIGNFSGTVNTNGQAVTWASGQQFQASDATWQAKTIVINGVNWTIGSVTDPLDLLLVNGQDAGVQNGVPYYVQYPINIPASDRNLTTYGSQLPSPTSYALTDTIPLIPDSAAMYLAFAVLAKIYGDDAELKDAAKARFCLARYQEGISIFKAALLESLGDSDDE